ncbi:hypothetical protein KSP40_PGU009652 [Platanthera guangdongensis]|uniref:Uncharacterized protein n=1 Tax=Platanthera guangdongensis TaxID=2320717 RepID=A0ABR2LZD9_9ASPA
MTKWSPPPIVASNAILFVGVTALLWMTHGSRRLIWRAWMLPSNSIAVTTHR